MGAGRAGGAEVVADIPRPDGFLLHGRPDGFLLYGRTDGFLPGDGRWQQWRRPREGPGDAGRAPDGPAGDGRLSAALRRRPIARIRHGGHATATEMPL